MRKRGLELAMTAALVVGILAGCGGNSANTSGSQAAQQSEAQTADGEQSREEVTLSAFIQQSVTGESGIWQGWGAQKLHDDLNMKINFDPTGNEVESKLSQYLVAGELPDIIGFKGLDQAQLAMDAGMLLPLDEYQDQLPNIFGEEVYQNAVKYSQDYTSGGSGKLYIMPTAIGPTAYNAYNWVPLLQWSVYKTLGKPEINTLEDYLDVVEQMVKEKPTTPDGEKVYGFSLFSDWDKYTALEISTLSFMYGIDTEYVSTLMETNIITNETKSLLADDSFYKRALKFYFDANQRGLLDPDAMTQTYDEMVAKLSSGRVMFSWFSWLTGTYNDPNAGHVNNEEDPDGYASVVAKDMKLYEAPDQTIGRNWYFGISKSCKNPDAALEFLNWLYDLDVCQYLTNGPEGVAWEKGENGEPVITNWDIVDQKTEMLMPEDVGGGAFQDGVYAFNTLGPQAATELDDGFTLSYRYWPSTIERDATKTKMKVEVNEWLGTTTLAEYLYANDMVGKSTQAVNMVQIPSDDQQIIETQIGEVVKKYSWQMVYAKDEAEFESLWQTMVNDAKGLGLDQITEYYTTEWNNALEKVKDYE